MRSRRGWLLLFVIAGFGSGVPAGLHATTEEDGVAPFPHTFSYVPFDILVDGKPIDDYLIVSLAASGTAKAWILHWDYVLIRVNDGERAISFETGAHAVMGTGPASASGVACSADRFSFSLGVGRGETDFVVSGRRMTPAQWPLSEGWDIRASGRKSVQTGGIARVVTMEWRTRQQPLILPYSRVTNRWFIPHKVYRLN